MWSLLKSCVRGSGLVIDARRARHNNLGFQMITAIYPFNRRIARRRGRDKRWEDKDVGQALDVDCLERCLAVTELVPTTTNSTWSVHPPYPSTSPQYHVLPLVATLAHSPSKGKNEVRRQTGTSAS